MVTGIIALLTSIAPLITSLGLTLINWFVKDKAEKEAAQRDFLSSVQDHLNDALLSVNTRFSAQKQSDDLDKIAQDLDNPPPAPKP